MQWTVNFLLGVEYIDGAHIAGFQHYEKKKQLLNQQSLRIWPAGKLSESVQYRVQYILG